jgi:cysteine desulfurase
MDRVYLDDNATTALAPEVVAAMQPWLTDTVGNPSSSHAWGRRAAAAVACARGQVADLLGCDPPEIIFCSGGSEACNHAIKGTAWAREDQGRHLIISAIEHPAVSEPAQWLARRGWRLSVLAASGDGAVLPAALDPLLRPDTVLVSVMHANNETGVVQPLRAIADRLQDHPAWLHADCAQSVGKIPVQVRELGVDLASLAGHKLHAPKGVGALYVRRGLVLENLVHGAGREDDRRAGTEAVAQIVALGEACRLAADGLAARSQRLAALRDRLAAQLRALVPGAVVHGERAPRLPGTLSIALPGQSTTALLTALQDRLAASAGAACHGAGVKISTVLAAMGVGEDLARGTLRLSVGRFTTETDVERAAALLATVLQEPPPGAAGDAD